MYTICYMLFYLTLNLPGNFLYIETSAPRRQGDTAVIQSQEIPVNPAYCFSFWYFMHGSSVGSLNVSYEMNGLPGRQVWTLSGEQGSQWKQAAVDIGNTPQSFHVSCIYPLSFFFYIDMLDITAHVLVFSL